MTRTFGKWMSFQWRRAKDPWSECWEQPNSTRPMSELKRFSLRPLTVVCSGVCFVDYKIWMCGGNPSSVVNTGSSCMHWMQVCFDVLRVFGCDSITLWGCISITFQTRPSWFKGNLSAVIYWTEILQPVAVSYLHNLGQDSKSGTHRARVIADNLQTVERMEKHVNGPDHKLPEKLGDWAPAHAGLTHTTTLPHLQHIPAEEWAATLQPHLTRPLARVRMTCQIALAT